MSDTFLEIVEIKEETKNGALEPRLCVAEDDNHYYVKSEYNAGLPDMLYEVIGASLAQYCYLPIPPFKIVQISEELVEASGIYNPAITEIIKPNSYAFASLAVEEATPLQKYNIEKISLDLRARVLLFDYWIKNSDRKMPTLEKANPNFLIAPATDSPFLIDHNNAFQKNLDAEAFFSRHIFGASVSEWTSNFLNREYLNFENAISQFDDIVALLPLEWKFGNRSLMSYNTAEEFKEILSRFSDADWIER